VQPVGDDTIMKKLCAWLSCSVYAEDIVPGFISILGRIAPFCSEVTRGTDPWKGEVESFVTWSSGERLASTCGARSSLVLEEDPCSSVQNKPPSNGAILFQPFHLKMS